MTATPPRRQLRRSAGIGAGLIAVVAASTFGATMAQAAPGFAFSDRVAGATRLETAVEASKRLYPNGGATDVVVVSQFSVVDGLTASYLAGLYDAPILFTETNSMSKTSSDELTRLGAKNVWIVGGTAVISQQLQDSWAKTYTVKRLGGGDRYATAAAVAQAPDRQGNTYEPEKVFIASGTRDADALAVGPIAYARNYPILLTEVNGVPQATRSALDALQTPTRIVVGGKAVISDAGYGAVGGTERFGGATRQETAAIVAENAVARENFTFESAALVGGRNENAADALTAAPLAGSTGTPLLFVEGDSVGGATAAYLTKHKVNLSGKGYVLGGDNAVSPKAAAEASAAAQ